MCGHGLVILARLITWSELFLLSCNAGTDSAAEAHTHNVYGGSRVRRRG